MLRELRRKDYGINSLLLANKRFTNPGNLMIRECILATSQEQKRRSFQSYIELIITVFIKDSKS